MKYFLLSAVAQILSLKRDLSRDLVLVNSSAIGRHQELQDHENGAVKATKVAQEV